ncbi:MAG: hypothetical protein M0D55_13195 [Elusimicrobiota bacterium]|nr:MAG: hypothetical protein M0D55_13195 [Elusimicrobiota bacterium]
MMGLWTDGWFYISSAGLAVSGVLFFFLLGQYRLASEAADAGEPDKEAESSAPAQIRPVYVPEESAPAAKVKAHEETKPRAAEPDTKPGEYAGPDRRKDPANTTGGISPAVVYLQNIKGELSNLHDDVRKLAKRVDDELGAVSTRDEALIERLAELTRAVESMKTAAAAPAAVAAAPAAEPAPKKVRKEPVAAPKTEPAPAPAPAPAAAPDVELAGLVAPEPKAAEPEPKAEPKIELKPEPAPAPKTETLSPDATIRLELGAAMGVPKEPEAPAPEEKPRRGPVWPV